MAGCTALYAHRNTSHQIRLLIQASSEFHKCHAYPVRHSEAFCAGVTIVITQERLKQVLHYEPSTGVFTRLTSAGPTKAGDIAGSPHSMGYLHVYVDGRQYLCHRLAHLYMTGSHPQENMDHINHVRNDNRWVNLRIANPHVNSRNRRLQARNKSGVPGVTWKPRDKRWYAVVNDNGKYVYLGAFKDFFSAACARKSAEIRFGYHENNGKH